MSQQETQEQLEKLRKAIMDAKEIAYYILDEITHNRAVSNCVENLQWAYLDIEPIIEEGK